MRISDWSSDVCSSDLEVYENSQTAFVASFVGENNPFTGKVVAADGGHAVVETAFGPLRGRNLGGLGAGSHAMLFVRPESLGPVNGHAPAQATNFNLFIRTDGRCPGRPIASSLDRKSVV